jgi:hypothetical protein
VIEAPSPNFDSRRAPPDAVILHYTGMQTGEAALERMRDPAAKVAATTWVEETGACSGWRPRNGAPGTRAPPMARREPT